MTIQQYQKTMETSNLNTSRITKIIETAARQNITQQYQEKFRSSIGVIDFQLTAIPEADDVVKVIEEYVDSSGDLLECWEDKVFI